VKKSGTGKQTTDDIVILCMHFACWITKAIDTHSEYVILLLHDNNGYTSVPHCYVYTYIVCLTHISTCTALTAILYFVILSS